MDKDKTHISYYPFFILKYSGQHYTSTKFYHTILFLANFTLYIIYLIFAVYGVYVSFGGEDVNFTLDCVMTISLCFHVIGKQLFHQFEKKIISELVEDSKHLWKLHNHPYYKGDIKKFFTLFKLLVHFYLISALVLSVLFCAAFYIADIPPMTMYIPNGWRTFICASFTYAIYFIYGSNIGLDTLFASICVEIITQFRLLQERLRNIDFQNETQLWQEVQELVDYHNFLLEYCAKLNKMANVPILLQFTITITEGCLQLYITTSSAYALIDKARYALFYVVTVLQATMYYWFGELVSEASLDVGDAIYDSKWFNVPITSYRKSITNIIIRSRNIVVLDGYGLVVANLGTLTLVLKTAFSYFTYLNTIGDNK